MFSGALGLPDIGQIFPDNDPEWSGADSSVFMEEAFRRMDSRWEARWTIVRFHSFVFPLRFVGSAVHDY